MKSVCEENRCIQVLLRGIFKFDCTWSRVSVANGAAPFPDFCAVLV